MTNSSKIPCIAADIQTLQSPPPSKSEREGVIEREAGLLQYFFSYWGLSLQIMGLGSKGMHEGEMGWLWVCERRRGQNPFCRAQDGCRYESMWGVWWEERRRYSTPIHKAKPLRFCSFLLIRKNRLKTRKRAHANMHQEAYLNDTAISCGTSRCHTGNMLSHRLRCVCSSHIQLRHIIWIPLGAIYTDFFFHHDWNPAR